MWLAFNDIKAFQAQMVPPMEVGTMPGVKCRWAGGRREHGEGGQGVPGGGGGAQLQVSPLEQAVKPKVSATGAASRFHGLVKGETCSVWPPGCHAA